MKSIASLVCLLALPASAQVANLKPAPGSSAEGKITISAGSDPATEIPVTILHGAKPGPTLAIVAGLSGTDYGPIIAVQTLVIKLVPADLSGTIIIVHVANFPAFLDRSLYLNPIDRKDLTRSFPGKADGTQSERIAHAITSQIIERSDAVLILQAGPSNTMLQPYVVQTVTGDQKLDAKISSMALAFGINFIVTSRLAQAPQTTLESAALTRLKPTLKVLCGSFGITDNRTSDAFNRGILGVLNLLEMIKDNPGKTRSPVYFDQVTALDSPQSGFLSIYVQRGQNVRKGEPLFGVSGHSGKNPVMVNSPVDGIVLSMISTPPVNKGEPVAVVGVPRVQ